MYSSERYDGADPWSELYECQKFEFDVLSVLLAASAIQWVRVYGSDVLAFLGKHGKSDKPCDSILVDLLMYQSLYYPYATMFPTSPRTAPFKLCGVVDANKLLASFDASSFLESPGLTVSDLQRQ